LLNVVVHRANVQDRDGIRRLLRDASRRFPSITKIFADASYQGPRAAQIVADTGAWQLEIVKPNCTTSSFCPSDGSSNAPSPGSVVTAGSLETSSDTPAPSLPSSASP
jgi:hypothetical protein